MEIKTCEQYVLNQLSKLEDEIESLKQEITKRDLIISEMTSVLEEKDHILNDIASNLSIKAAYDGTPYINFDSIWKSYDKDKFEYLKTTLNLNDTESEDKDNA